jgi:hypothetical protein
MAVNWNPRLIRDEIARASNEDEISVCIIRNYDHLVMVPAHLTLLLCTWSGKLANPTKFPNFFLTIPATPCKPEDDPDMLLLLLLLLIAC